MHKEKTDVLIEKMLLSSHNIQLASLFADYDKEDDLIFTFFSFLISRCIIRYAHGYQKYGIFEFSNPGRKIMKNKNQRMAFVEEFVNFYES